MNPPARRVRQVRLVLPYPPSVNKLRAIYTPKKGPARLLDTDTARAYKEAVRLLLRAAGAQLRWTDPLRLEVDLFRPRRAGDATNPIKVLEDGLQTERLLEEVIVDGVRGRRRVEREAGLYEDDEQTVEVHVRRYEDKEYPRVQVRITCVTGPGGPAPERWPEPAGWAQAKAVLAASAERERQRQLRKEAKKAARATAPAHATPSRFRHRGRP